MDGFCCAGCPKHVVGLDLAFALRSPHNGGAGRVAAPSDAPEAGEYGPQRIAIKGFSCGEPLREDAERTERPPSLRRYLS